MTELEAWVIDKKDSIEVWWLMLGAEKRQLVLALGISVIAAAVNLASTRAEMRIRRA